MLGFDTAFVEIELDTSENVNIDLKATELEAVFSGAGDDVLTSSYVAADLTDEQGIDVYIDGGAGDDLITGGDGDDWLVGGDGADTLAGGAGDDILFVDASDSAADISGGEGNDTIIVQDTAGVTLDLFASEVESAFGGDGDDAFSSSGSDDVILDGGAGDDAVRAERISSRSSGSAPPIVASDAFPS